MVETALAIEPAPAPLPALNPDGPMRLRIESITVITSTLNETHNHATITACLESTPTNTYEGRGVGPIDAMCKALQHFEPGFDVAEWSGKAIGRGSEAVAIIKVTIYTTNGSVYHGEGRHQNTMQATADAIADALNRHFLVRHRNSGRRKSTET
ncbi:MAG TPA: alpha-isopropylmalate synthase regulatory domain-containing protein [Candidatus Paceibacterota bacterium]|nr:alpha-isopropylmalate synthase regulatory domain-containing protein [Candidatus Paceibacterota bacterium]